MRPLYRSKAAAPSKVQAALFFLPSFQNIRSPIYYHSSRALSIETKGLSVIGISSCSVTFRANANRHNVVNLTSTLPASIFTICILSMRVTAANVLIVYPLSVLSFLICSPSIINSSVTITLRYYCRWLGQHVKNVDDYHT